MSDDLRFRVALTLIPKVGAVKARNLMSYCGSARAVFEASPKMLATVPGIGEQIVSHIRQPDLLDLADQEIAFMTENGIQPVFYLDKGYPKRLSHLPDAPPMLYYKGEASLNPERSVAIVGTRKPTPQGVRACEEIVEGLQAYGVTIISGLAYGIDVAAHRTALAMNIPTIGVVAHGLRHIYPPQHIHTAREMMEAGGVLSEYPSPTPPDRERFPMRNRIIAGLCDALIVVETQRKGGSMISAQMANDYHKDVFAVPGRPKERSTEGCNLLIKSHRASLIEQARDLAYVMQWEEKKPGHGIQQALFPDLSPEEDAVVQLLKEKENRSIDELVHQLQRSPQKMAADLLELEFKGLIKSLPGKRYTLLA
ncbi:DNA-processing protein DprA [Phaeodactylibacter luteus]|uniref:DNA-protecting protein DprA n=1 Tax=Phaeodactylibacter luteus TaxID=1564516 RepID=A0A5C6RHU5_9BACT|nr:DNA-processing protein DprA [Phaeodactylibacter luteus]TXB61604.1 DNA-protecting protein DprA [Phaeodactylibacter luteus]